jgi:hypothetical protein
MIKKLIYVSVGVILLGLLLFGRSAFSYLRTSAGYVRESVQSSVPVDFQIERARTMIKDLTPEVRKNMQMIAKEEVELKRLEEQIAGAETRLAKDKDQLLRLKTDVASGKDSFKYAGRTYTADEVKTDLTNRLERYKTGEATLTSLKDIRAARQKALTAAQQKLEGMLAAKRQ